MSPKLALLALLVAAPVSAQDTASLARSQDRSTINGRAGAGLQGVASVNVAAGAGNVQANVRAIALASGAAVASAHQHVVASPAETQRDARAVLTGSAFNSSDGVIGLNQAAGSANAQLNVLAVGADAMAAFGQQIDNLALAAIRVDSDAGTDGAVVVPAPVREARIGGTAARSPTGILQLNQTAGAGNASANAIVLQLPGGTP